VPKNESGDLWYMSYRDDEGAVHTVKGTTDNIRKAYRDGLLGDASNIRACRSKQGPFQPLHDFPEFRDLVVKVDSVPEIGEALKTSDPRDSVRRSPVPDPARPSKTPAPVATPNRIWSETAPTEQMTVQSALATPIPSASPTAEYARHQPDPPRRHQSGSGSFAIWLAIIALAVAIGMLSVMLFAH
jgi:hypothetical protein